MGGYACFRYPSGCRKPTIAKCPGYTGADGEFNPCVNSYCEDHHYHDLCDNCHRLRNMSYSSSPIRQYVKADPEKERKAKEFLDFIYLSGLLGLFVFFSTPLFLMIPFLKPFAPFAIVLNTVKFISHGTNEDVGFFAFIAYVVVSYIIGVIIVGLDRLFRQWKA